jgi:uroporphyrinogen decarboxylase
MLRGEPDHVPLAEAGVDQIIKELFLGQPVQSLREEIDFWALAGYDYVPISVGLRSMLGPDLRTKGKRFTGVKTFHTSHYHVSDEMESERAWAQEGKGIITTHEAFEAFSWPTIDEFDFSGLDEAKRMMPPKMKAVAQLGYIFLTAWQVMGLESMCEALIEDPELVQKVVDKIGSIQLQVFERIIDHEALGAILQPDDFAYSEDLLISPNHLRNYIFPYYREMGAVCKRKDIPVILHSDGRLYKILDDIVECGFNAIHPVEPKAMDIRELKQSYGDRLCLIGNLDLGGVFTMGTPEEVREATKRLIEDIGPGGGYCVGSSNSVTEYVPLANYTAMQEAVFELGWYR